MKGLRKIAALVMAAMMALPALAGDNQTIKVTPVAQDADAANGGVIYALPKTVVQIKLTAQVVVSSVGPYYQYSTRFLNLTDVVTENSTKWKLTSADIIPVGRVDFSRRYKISASANSALPSIALTPDGVISAINTNGAAPVVATESEAPEIKYATFAEVPLSQSVLARTSKAAMAEECAQTIYSLRAARVGIITGQVDNRLADAGSMSQALANIDKLERQHVELFAGRRDTITVTKIIEVTPDYNGANNIVPARFSESSGFVDAMDLSGKPIYVDLEFDDSAKVNEYAATSKQRQSDPLTGLFYMIPGNVSIKVMDRNILLTQKTIRCTQNGQVANLPANQILTNALTFDPATGALTSVAPVAK